MVIASKDLSWWRIYIYVVLTYILSHGLMLFIYGAWWDDMICWNVSKKTMDAQYELFNNPFIYYIQLIVSQINDLAIMTLVFRLIAFLCWLLSITAFYLLVRRMTNNKSFTLYASLLAASCGLNKCILMICCYHYTISIMLFMVGCLFFVYDYFEEKFTYKVCSVLFWLISLLVWRSAVIVIPVLLIYFSTKKCSYNNNDYRNVGYYIDVIKNCLHSYYPIIVSLFIFAILYKTVLAPKGMYESYYSIDIKNIVLSPLMVITSSFSLIIGYLSNILNIYAYAGSKVVFVIPLLLFCSFFSNVKNCNEKIGKEILIFAILFLLSSSAPHVLRSIAFAFSINGYGSRVASLSIFPLAIIIAFLVFRIPFKYRSIFFAFLLSSSISYSIIMYVDYNRGWARNEAVSKIFKNNKYLDGKKILVTNRALEFYTFICEDDRYYDYEGCARLAYGVDTKTRCMDYYMNKNSFKPDYYLYIDKREPITLNGSLDYFFYNIKLFIYRIFDREKYDSMIINMLQYRILSGTEDFKYL